MQKTITLPKSSLHDEWLGEAQVQPPILARRPTGDDDRRQHHLLLTRQQHGARGRSVAPVAQQAGRPTPGTVGRQATVQVQGRLRARTAQTVAAHGTTRHGQSIATRATHSVVDRVAEGLDDAQLAIVHTLRYNHQLSNSNIGRVTL